MKRKENEEAVLSKKTDSVYSSILSLFICGWLISISVVDRLFILGLIVSLLSIIIIYVLLKIKRIRLLNDRFVCKYLFFKSKEILWEIKYNEITRIEIDYYSDVRFRPKHIFLLHQGKLIKDFRIVNVLMREFFHNLRKVSDIPIYYNNGEKGMVRFEDFPIY